MKYSFLVALSLLFIGQTMAQELRTFTLAEAISFAENGANSIKIAQANIADADLRIKENKSTGLPKVDASLSGQSFLIMPKSILPESFAYAFIPRDSFGNPVREPTKEDRTVTFGVRNSITGAISASQLVFSGSYIEAKRAARLYRSYADDNLESSKYTVRTQVVDAYLPALMISESVKTLDKNISNLEKLLFETGEFNKAGFVEALDVDRLTLTLSNLRTERDNLNRQIEVVYNALKMVMNYPLDSPIAVSDNIQTLLKSPETTDLEGAVNLSGRPELRVLEQVEKLNQVNYDVIRAGRLPTVAAFLNYQMQLTGDNIFKDGFFIPTSLVGFQASVPIYDSNTRKYQMQRAQISTEIVRLQRNDAERAFSMQVLNARIAYKNALIRVDSQKKNIELAERIQRVSQTKYREGVGSSIEVIQAEQSLYQTQQNLIQAQFDLLMAQKSLEKALGKF